jgi:RNA polymerase sigma-70 factor (ECF subfamily)
MNDPTTGRRDDVEDRALVARFLATRSDEAFLRLYDRHTPALYRFAARLAGGSGTEPAEVVQEAWVRALARLAEFRWGSSLGTWLCGIVLNRARELRRGDERDRRIVALVERDPQTSPPPESAWSRAVADAVAGLPDGYREILLLHDVEGYTHEEIARHFGIVEGTSKSQLHRARLALREVLRAKGARQGG